MLAAFGALLIIVSQYLLFSNVAQFNYKSHLSKKELHKLKPFIRELILPDGKGKNIK